MPLPASRSPPKQRFFEISVRPHRAARWRIVEEEVRPLRSARSGDRKGAGEGPPALPGGGRERHVSRPHGAPGMHLGCYPRALFFTCAHVPQETRDYRPADSAGMCRPRPLS